MKPWLSSHQLTLAAQFKNDMFPHALLINGVSSSGKLELAQWLIQLLNCQQATDLTVSEGVTLQGCGHCKSCLLLDKNTFPDHLKLVAQKNNLGIDDIRYANSFLQKTAYLGKFKTVLIENVQTMTPQAMNALLKTLEEPTDHSVIILLTNDIEMLLPTIISRCRVLTLRPSVGHSLVSQLKAQGIKTEPVNSEETSLLNDPFINLTQLPELTDTSTLKAFNVFKENYLQYLYSQEGESQLLDSLLSSEHALRWLEQITVNLHRESFLERADDEQKLNSQLLNNLYKVIINGCKVIKSYTQANKQFVCEQLMMAISDVVEQHIIEVRKNTSV